ncbi:MAG: hypothetical protein WCK02_08350 [Bacteroidota bacterium]
MDKQIALINKKTAIVSRFIVIVLLVFAFQTASFSQKYSEVQIQINSSKDKIPHTIGKDTCVIITTSQIRNESIVINGGTLIINKAFRLKNILLNEGRLFNNSLLVTKNLRFNNATLQNEKQIIADSVTLEGKTKFFYNNGHLRCSNLLLHENSVFENIGILVSQFIIIEDGSVIRNSPNAFISSSSNIFPDYRKVITCYYSILSLKISEYIKTSDWILVLIYLFSIICISWFLNKNARFKYLILAGLIAKILFGIIGTLLYGYYYKGGDLFEYFNSAKALNSLMLSHPLEAIQIYFGNNSPTNIRLLEETSNYSIYSLYFKSLNSFTTIRIYSIVQLFASNSLLASVVLINAFAYIGIWQFFKTISKLYPGNRTAFAMAILFLPSVLFWSSQLLKDTIVFSCLLCLMAGLIQVSILKKKKYSNLLWLIINFLIISMIKPYVLIALIPFILIIVYYHKIINASTIKSKLKIILLCLLFGGIMDWAYMATTEKIANSAYGSVEKVMDKAKVTREDHLRSDLYGKNAYNLGKINKSIDQILIAPAAIFTGLFRPMPWDIGNILMILPAIINSLILLFAILALFKTYNQPLLNDPFSIALIGYILLYSYGIGISSSNFGALSRFQIMIVPFLLVWLIVRLNLRKIVSLKKNNT